MIVNLTMNGAEFFENEHVFDYKRDEVVKIGMSWWMDNERDIAANAKALVAIALESGAKKAILDVPVYCASMVEIEFMLHGIIPAHYSSTKIVDIDVDGLLESFYRLIELHTRDDELEGREDEIVETALIQEVEAKENFVESIKPEENELIEEESPSAEEKQEIPQATSQLRRTLGIKLNLGLNKNP